MECIHQREGPSRSNFSAFEKSSLCNPHSPPSSSSSLNDVVAVEFSAITIDLYHHYLLLPLSLFKSSSAIHRNSNL
ncbi:aminopeptidase P family protein [Sesbania bispinosa]|nr:aminopeptidase P family protein [Sesbania bispinosa]